MREPLHRSLVAAIVAAALAGPAAATAQAEATAGAASCAGASVHPDDLNRAQERRATLCLINAERRERDREPLRHNARLALAGDRHVRDMVAHDYFAHDSRDGRDFVDRIVAAGYVSRRSRGWILGENLAWGLGRSATPRAIVRAWMNSRPHRANILHRGFREIGIAVVPGTPTGDDEQGATYATEFGARR